MKTKIDNTNNIESIQVKTNRYLSLRKAPVSIKEILDIKLSDHAYLPNVVDLRNDWVAWIAIPAFKRYRKKYRKFFYEMGFTSNYQLEK